MGNNFVQGLYDMAKIDPSKEMTKSDERRFKKALDSNSTLFRQNKDIFESTEKRFLTCRQYIPCPVCHKCKAKASHIHIKCQNCTIPICRHTYADAKLMIKRAPFTIKATTSMAKMILGLEQDMIQNKTGGSSNEKG